MKYVRDWKSDKLCADAVHDKERNQTFVTYASLADALQAYDIELPASQVLHIDEYCRLLWAWNEKLNLTRHTDYETFAIRDVVDTMALSDLLSEGSEVLDVGTGGGVPGVPLAIIRPDLQVSLCESVGKRANAVADIVENLQLPVPVYHERAEDHLEESRYDCVVARGVAPLWKILTWFQSHWLSIGTLYLIKGSRWLDERAEARHKGLMKNINLRKAAEYQTPKTGAENVILQVSAR